MMTSEERGSTLSGISSVVNVLAADSTIPMLSVKTFDIFLKCVLRLISPGISIDHINLHFYKIHFQWLSCLYQSAYTPPIQHPSHQQPNIVLAPANRRFPYVREGWIYYRRAHPSTMKVTKSVTLDVETAELATAMDNFSLYIRECLLGDLHLRHEAMRRQIVTLVKLVEHARDLGVMNQEFRTGCERMLIGR